MKWLTIVTISFLFIPSLQAGEMKHTGNQLKMGHKPPHEGMKGMDDHHNMTPSKLGKYKKTKFKSKKKHFYVHAPLVPMSDGWGVFEITITNRAGKALNSAKIGHATFEMPGMKMDLPAVQVKHLGANKWRLGLPIAMAGMWKIKLPISEGSVKDTVYVKFVSK